MEIELFKISYYYKCYEDEEMFNRLQNTLSQSVFSLGAIEWKDPADLEKLAYRELDPIKYVATLNLNKIDMNLLQKELFVSRIHLGLKDNEYLTDLRECNFRSSTCSISFNDRYDIPDKIFFSDSLIKSLKNLRISYTLFNSNSGEILLPSVISLVKCCPLVENFIIAM